MPEQSYFSMELRIHQACRRSNVRMWAFFRILLSENKTGLDEGGGTQTYKRTATTPTLCERQEERRAGVRERDMCSGSACVAGSFFLICSKRGGRSAGWGCVWGGGVEAWRTGTYPLCLFVLLWWERIHVAARGNCSLGGAGMDGKEQKTLIKNGTRQSGRLDDFWLRRVSHI